MRFAFLSFRRGWSFRAFGFGLSLMSLWSIGVAPVRGGTYFLCRRKESKQRKRLHTANVQADPPHSHSCGAINAHSLAQQTAVTRQSSVPAALRAPSGKQPNHRAVAMPDGSSRYPRFASASVRASAPPAPRRGEADGPRFAKTTAPSYTIPASTSCEAGGMTALSRVLNVRGDGFQMIHCRGCAGDPVSIGGVKRLSLPTFFAAAKKVGAAPHRGSANRPQRLQGKANKKTQTGVAIISALLVVALSAILVSGMLWRQQVQIRRIENQRLLSQAQWVARGALDWTRLILRSEGDTSAGITYLGGLWGVPIAKTRLSDFLGQIGEVRAQQGAETYLSGSIEDAQAKFNLRNLVESPAPGVMQLDMNQIGAYQRLLASLGANSQLAKTTAIQVRASLAQSATRFQTITSTNGTTATPPPIQGGATGGSFTNKPGIEDSEDSSANAPIQMTSVDSLLDIPGYTPEMVARLRPFVTVLPTVSAVNVNTASAEVIAAVVPGMSVSTAQAFVARRQTVFFRNVGDIQLALRGAGVQSVSIDPSELDVNSNYFLIHGRVQHERAEVDRTTLVYRDALTHTTRIVRVEDQL